MMKKIAISVAVLTSAPALAQTPPEAYKGEIIMTRSGQLVPPWKETKACPTKTSTECSTAIINNETREVARYNGKWASKFELTGNGQEVRRAETAMAKAVRLKGKPK